MTLLAGLTLTGCTSPAPPQGDAAAAKTEAETETEEVPTKCADFGEVYGDVQAVKLQHNPERGYSCEIGISSAAEVTKTFFPPEDFLAHGGTEEGFAKAQAKNTSLLLSVLNANEGTEELTDTTMGDEWWANEAPLFYSEYVIEQVYTAAPTPTRMATAAVTPPAIYDAKSKYSDVKIAVPETALVKVTFPNVDPTVPYLRVIGKTEYVKRAPSYEALQAWVDELASIAPELMDGGSGESEKPAKNEKTGEWEISGSLELTTFYKVQAVMDTVSPAWVGWTWDIGAPDPS